MFASCHHHQKDVRNKQNAAMTNQITRYHDIRLFYFVVSMYIKNSRYNNLVVSLTIYMVFNITVLAATVNDNPMQNYGITHHGESAIERFRTWQLSYIKISYLAK